MSGPFELHGSYFVPAAHGPLLWNELSTDSRFLGVVTQGIAQTFLAHVFHRTEDHQYIGTWWAELDTESVTDSLLAAQTIARARIAQLASTPPPNKSLERTRER